ncbi:phage tail protein [Fusobacterium nucleatum]
MAFRGLTKKGADYLATRLANELAVEFLKVEIGDGAVLSGQNPKNQTSLISYKKQAKILKKEQENNAINITIQITNDDITQGFYLKEIGIYVNDSSDEGCLYWYCNEDNAQYIPAKSDSVIAFEIDIRMEVTNSDATIINWSGKNTWINKEYLEENYTKNGGYKGTAREIEDRVVAALGKEDGKFPLLEAVKGNVYYFTGNKKFYICKETQNRRVSVPDGNFEELSIWENRKRLENLSTFKIQELYSAPTGVKFTIFQYGSLILIAAYTYGTEKLNYGTSYKCNLPYDCYNTATAITGNNSSSGQFSLVNNVLIVNSTDNQVPLKNSFMGQLITFLK